MSVSLTTSFFVRPEERERAVLLDQEIKAQEERQRQLEEKMAIEEQNNEERVRQVIQKMEEEMFVQQQETKRAMDSKLREQAALTEKDFQEKAKQMACEVEQLRRNNKEEEERKSRVFAQMIADQEQRNAQNMEVLRQQHRQQMEAINSRPRPSSSSCSIQWNVLTVVVHCLYRIHNYYNLTENKVQFIVFTENTHM